MARFSFPATTRANLVLQLAGSQRADLETSFTRAQPDRGRRARPTSGNFCGTGTSYTVYFDMQFSQPVHPQRHARPGRACPARAGLGVRGPDLRHHRRARRCWSRSAISYVSAANARLNLAAENPGWNFTAHPRTGPRAAWNALLGRIRVGGGSADQQSRLLHRALPLAAAPERVQRRQRPVPGHRRHRARRGPRPRRLLHELLRLGHLPGPGPARGAGRARPRPATPPSRCWTTTPRTACCPSGSRTTPRPTSWSATRADPVLADYYAFGARDFDAGHGAGRHGRRGQPSPGPIRPGLNYLDALGYLPVDGSYGCCNYYEPVSTTLEYDTDDFAISALAGALGQGQDRGEVPQPGPRTGATCSTRSAGWTSAGRPAELGAGLRRRHATTGFVEASSLIYTGMVPFNLAGLARAKGGRAAMAAYLDNVLRSFTGAARLRLARATSPASSCPGSTTTSASPPGPSRSSRQVQDQLWTDTPAGAGDGNDDLGGLSAWYVWSALGLYPETPGTADLALGSPVFPHAVITPGRRPDADHPRGRRRRRRAVRAVRGVGRRGPGTRAYAPPPALIAAARSASRSAPARHRAGPRRRAPRRRPMTPAPRGPARS